ncbi:MAG: ferredoxin [Actinomycetota bacterium]|nr:ferredoxin [Actinomycetota bacterium]
MRIAVDPSKCQGHNRCMIFAPDVFEVDDYGFATVQDPAGTVPEERVEAVRTAVANCPELAISVLED